MQLQVLSLEPQKETPAQMFFVVFAKKIKIAF